MNDEFDSRCRFDDATRVRGANASVDADANDGNDRVDAFERSIRRARARVRTRRMT